MAIVHLGGNKIKGLSGDTKPTNVPTNSVFIETNTPARFIFNGSSWVQLGGGGTPTSIASGGSFPNAYGSECGGYSRSNQSYLRSVDSGSSYSSTNMKSGGFDITIANDNTLVVCTAVASWQMPSSGRTGYVAVFKDGVEKASASLSVSYNTDGTAVTWSEVVNAGTYNYEGKEKLSYSGDAYSSGGGFTVVVVESQ
jgi:hypothetical protein